MNIGVDLKDTDINTRNWVIQDKEYRRALVNAALNLRFISQLIQLSY
jgi:hypothetical protein